jgi:hypothetical protein
VFTECETSYQGFVRGRDADARVALQTVKCVLGVALESLQPTISGFFFLRSNGEIVL